ncbi:MAG: shikimate dehydrogenase [Campylobacterales bacterium]|nr:shikimate dehydrogenase [Campylobacterales bacterium]
MTLYTLFGNPVAHSLSPRMHNLAFARLGIQGAYMRSLLEDGERLREVFFALKLNGANVTVPHKEAAFRACDKVLGIATSIKAVNTLINDNGVLVGYNTDAPGFLRAIASFKTVRSALILGAGGTAKALAYALRETGIAPTILNRSAPKLEAFQKDGFACFTHETFSLTPFDLIINTTSAGLSDNALPASKAVLEALFTHASYVFEVIYKPTPFLALASAHGLTCKDGKEMLLWQGVLAFNLFHHNTLAEETIATAMQEALRLSS